MVTTLNRKKDACKMKTIHAWGTRFLLLPNGRKYTKLQNYFTEHLSQFVRLCVCVCFYHKIVSEKHYSFVPLLRYMIFSIMILV